MRLIESKLYKDIHRELTRHFNGDKVKATDWMMIENPYLGGITPIDMILMGRGEKLKRFILGAVEENHK